MEVLTTAQADRDVAAPAAAAATAPLGPSSQLAVRASVTLVDVLIFALAFLAASAVRAPRLIDFDVLPRQVLVVSLLMVGGLALQGSYEFERVRSARQLLARLTFGVLTGLGLVVFCSYVVPEIAIGRGVFALDAVFALPFIVLWRRLVFRTLREEQLRPRALVLGEPRVARKIARALCVAELGGADVVGILTPGAEDADAAEAGAVPVLGDYSRLAEVVRSRDVTRAVVVDGRHDRALPLDATLALRKAGLRLEDGPEAYESVTGKLLVEKLTPGVFVFASAFEVSPLERNLRSIVGVVLAAASLVLLAPLLGLVALAIVLDSRGTVLFRQSRVGEHGRLFELLKFRTMREDAEAATGPVWAAQDDPRVTRLGRILRRTRIDELPQLWNVLRGDMFFVGPRPERPHFVEMLKEKVPLYDYRHAVKPGITGWAQIHYGYGSSVADAIEKLHYDLYYIQNSSPFLDMEIVLGTIQKVLGAGNRN